MARDYILAHTHMALVEWFEASYTFPISKMAHCKMLGRCCQHKLLWHCMLLQFLHYSAYSTSIKVIMILN